MFPIYPYPCRPRVLRLSPNLLGRDFVLGDIHGAFQTVLAAMRAANFDEEVDRLFVVGDLLDRGRDSALCAAFLGLPYVFAVAGNHEDMLLELYKNGEPAPEVLAFFAQRNGFGWWLATPLNQRREVLEAIKLLPLVIELETTRGTVGILHADIPAGMDWATFTEQLEAGNPRVRHTCLWGRERITARDDAGNTVNGGTPDVSGVAGIARVFVGHTPQWEGARRYGNVYAIDTGAIFGEQGIKDGARLTFAHAICSTAVLTQPRRTGLVDVREDPPGNEHLPVLPFGSYWNASAEQISLFAKAKNIFGSSTT